MKRPLLILTVAALALLSCAAPALYVADAEAEIDVFGAKLLQKTDMKEVNGEKAVREPCVKGYEYVFEGLKISIGYGFDGKIRKITTRNPENSVYAVKVGDSYETGRMKLLSRGFGRTEDPFRFTKADFSVTLLANESNFIFGVRAELLD